MDQAFFHFLSSLAWASAVVAVAMLADRQVTRIFGSRTDVAFDARVKEVEDHLARALGSLENRLADTQKSANASALAVGLSPVQHERPKRNA